MGEEGGRRVGPPASAGPEATVRRYHEATKHVPGRLSSSPYGLHWHNEPDLFKRYPGIEAESPPEELARLLGLGAGVHPRRGDPHYRTFMSAGALHPVELYVATRSGLFHYHAGEGTLRQLRAEDPRPSLAAAAAAPELSAASVVLVLTGILWRTAWKYGARGWRHVFWDAGAMLANLLALTHDTDPQLLTAFVDSEVAATVGVEPARESPVALLAAGSDGPACGPKRLEPLHRPSPALSPREHHFAQAEEAQAASSLATVAEVRAWREQSQRLGVARGAGKPPEPLEEVILRRGSARNFTPDPLGIGELEAVLSWACAPIPGDLPPLCSTFVIAHAVQGLEPGVYRFEPPDRFERVRKGAERDRTADLCLGQSLAGKASAVIFFTADLDRTLLALGARGYRAAQTDAGIRAGRASLGAYARGLGASGLTFYDDEVRRALGTKDEPMMCLAVGVDARRRSLRRARLPS